VSNDTIEPLEGTTLIGLSNGQHTLAVLASDTSGHTNASETIHFTIAQEAQPETEQSTPETQPSEPFPTISVAVASMSVAVVGAGLLAYFKKRKH
jgi:hypothetical protein